MRLSREKIVRISHQLVELLVQSNEVEFIEDRDTIRQHMVQTMTNVLREEEKMEVEVRKRITSQKKEILEGSEEWDVLFRKYYSEELRRAGIAAAPGEHQKAGHRKAFIVWLLFALILPGLAIYGVAYLIGLDLHAPTLTVKNELLLKGVAAF